MGGEGAFECASKFLRRSLEITADTVRTIDSGWAIVTPSLPQVWSLNQVWVTPPVSYTRATELAGEYLADLPYRHLIAEDELGRSFAQPLQDIGFKLERELVMIIIGGTDGDGECGKAPRMAKRQVPAVIEPDERTMLDVERRWLGEDERVTSPDGIEQLLEAGLREGRAWGERRFGIAGEDGKLAAITKLRSNGTTAQVEDVYRVPEARGRGFARALVTHAVRVAQCAGHELIFIVADDDDWPKQLYASVGFRPAGLRWAFHRELPRSAEATQPP